MAQRITRALHSAYAPHEPRLALLVLGERAQRVRRVRRESLREAAGSAGWLLSRVRSDHRRRRADRRRPERSGGGIAVQPPPASKPKLSRREIEVLQLIADGLGYRDVGRELFISEETVKSHVRHLLAKLEARSRAHAVIVGLRRGLIS
jgi:DNA-binding NarL/FixJ family response regulator